MALQPAQQQLRKFYAVPNQGLNSRFDPTLLHDTEAAQLINLQVNQDGTLSKYPGYSLDGSPFPNNADSFIRMLWNFKRGSSVNTLLIAAQDDGNTNSLYKVDIKQTTGNGVYTYIGHTLHTATITTGSTAVTGQSTTWLTQLKAGDKIKATADPDSDYIEIATVNSDTSLTLVTNYLGTGVSTGSYIVRKIWNYGNIPRATTFDNFAVITNGSEVPQLWDNTSLNSITDANAPPARYLTVHKNRLFMANTSGNPSRLYWSHADDPTAWEADSNEDVSIQDGGDIVSIMSFAGSLVVLKSNGTAWQVVGNFDQDIAGSPDSVRQIDLWQNIGIIAERSPVIHQNYLYFLCETGIYRIDQRMYCEKVSYVIDPFTNTINYTLAGAISRSFPENSISSWNTGTNDGTWVDINGLHSFFDSYSQTDAYQNWSNCSVSIGTDNTLYVAYVVASNTHQINFVRYRPGGSVLGGNAIQKESSILTNDRGQIQALSVAVNPSDNTVGLVYTINGSGDVYYVERSADIQASFPTPFSYGTWNQDINTLIGSVHELINIRLIYSPGGNQHVVWNADNTTVPITTTGFAVKAAGVWNGQDFYSDNTDAVDIRYPRCNIAIDSSGNLYVSAFTTVRTELRAFQSTDGGAVWSSIEVYTLPTAADDRSELSCGFNHAGNFISVFSNTAGAVIRRNHTLGTTITLNTTAGSYSGGWFSLYNTLDGVNVDTDNYFQVLSAASNDQEQITANYNLVDSLGNTVTNPTTNTVKNSGSATVGLYRPGMGCYTNNGRTVAIIFFGTNTNEVVIRRISPFAVYTSQDNSDSTLTAWGTFVVTGEVDNGNTVTHALALGSVANPTMFTTATSGQVISSDPSLIFVINRIEVALQTWSGIAITSIVLNYFGAGVDSKQVIGQEFFNEAYWAVCTTGNGINNIVLIQDIASAYITATYSVSAMARFNTFLYGGSASNGDLYILKQNYDYNGSVYSTDFQSREDFFNIMERDKEIYRAFITFKTQPSGSFIFSYRFNNFLTPGGVAWNQVTVDQTQSFIVEIPDLAGKLFRSLQFRIQDSNMGVPISIIGFTILYSMVAQR